MSERNFKKSYKARLKKRREEAGTVRKIVASILTILVLFLLVVGLSGYFYIKSALEPVDPNDESQKSVEIPLGSSTSQIAGILEKNEIIKNDLIFRFYTKFNNESGFQAGEYQLTSSMTLNEIIDSLQSGKLIKDPAFKVTIPEGRTLDQIAGTLAKKLPFTKDEFLAKVNDKEYVKELMEQYPELLTDEILNEEIKYPLEGYLFASTYPVYVEDPTIDQIVKKMLDQTKEVVLPYKEQLAQLDLLNDEMTLHELMTMASLLENEARTSENRKKIASVFYNRIEEEMPLQTDPTVLYALGEHKDRVLYEDLEVDSPYNTYEEEGLPPGPISNFNENSLKAVVQPADTDFLYFLADSEGNIYYSKTLEKHNEKKNKYINNN
ncbi:endolytic transglycosylase MltG [Halobacillus sp. K22]|uniref:endolytic transglycosylase MltG n=1 Tax=Halobacillus sp. K22 TaxID=3457431 RepID=UPI003FCC66FC